MSKGSNRRREDAEKVRSNWDAIFRKDAAAKEEPLVDRLRAQNSKWMGDCPAVYEEAAEWIEEMTK